MTMPVALLDVPVQAARWPDRWDMNVSNHLILKSYRSLNPLPYCFHTRDINVISLPQISLVHCYNNNIQILAISWVWCGFGFGGLRIPLAVFANLQRQPSNYGLFSDAYCKERNELINLSESTIMVLSHHRKPQ